MLGSTRTRIVFVLYALLALVLLVPVLPSAASPLDQVATYVMTAPVSPPMEVRCWEYEPVYAPESGLPDYIVSVAGDYSPNHVDYPMFSNESYWYAYTTETRTSVSVVADNGVSSSALRMNDNWFRFHGDVDSVAAYQRGYDADFSLALCRYFPDITGPAATSQPAPPTLTRTPSRTPSPTVTPQGTPSSAVSPPAGTTCYRFQSQNVTLVHPNGSAGNQAMIAFYPIPPWPSASYDGFTTASNAIYLIGLLEHTNVYLRVAGSSGGAIRAETWNSYPATHQTYPTHMDLNTTTYQQVPSTIDLFYVRNQLSTLPFSLDVCLGNSIDNIYEEMVTPTPTATAGTPVATPNWTGFPTQIPVPQPYNCQQGQGPASSSCLQLTQIALQKTQIALMNPQPTNTAGAGTVTVTMPPGVTATTSNTPEPNYAATSVSVQLTSLAIQQATAGPLPYPTLTTPTAGGSPVPMDAFGTVVAMLCEREPCHSVTSAGEMVGELVTALEPDSEGLPAPCFSNIDFPVGSGPWAIDPSTGYCYWLHKTEDIRGIVHGFSVVFFAGSLIMYLIHTLRRVGLG